MAREIFSESDILFKRGLGRPVFGKTPNENFWTELTTRWESGGEKSKKDKGEGTVKTKIYIYYGCVGFCRSGLITRGVKTPVSEVQSLSWLVLVSKSYITSLFIHYDTYVSSILTVPNIFTEPISLKGGWEKPPPTPSLRLTLSFSGNVFTPIVRHHLCWPGKVRR